MQSPAGESRPSPPPVPRGDGSGSRRAFERLLQKRVKRFVALVPVVLAGEEPDAVHDVRVASRRVQQAISAVFPKPRSGTVQELRRMPRRVRRAVGEWRNCDVLLDLVARRQRRVRREAKRQAWGLVRAYLVEKRRAEIVRARKKLLRQDPASYADRAHRLLAHPLAPVDDRLAERLCESVREAWTEWDAALARAGDTRAVADLHAFRVATKALRYRTELLHEAGFERMKAPLAWLEHLQDALGTWHDRQILRLAVAEAVGRGDVLLNALPSARVLLAELDAERRRPAADVDRILRLAREHPGRAHMERWSQTHSADAPDAPPAVAGDGTRRDEVSA